MPAPNHTVESRWLGPSSEKPTPRSRAPAGDSSSLSSPSLCCRSCHCGVPRWLFWCGFASCFLLTHPLLQLPHSLQAALQLSVDPSRHWCQLGQLGQRLHLLQATLQPSQLLLGKGEAWSEDTKEEHKTFGTQIKACFVPAAGAWLSLGQLCQVVSLHPAPGWEC